MGKITAHKLTSTQLLACFLNILMARFLLRATSTVLLTQVFSSILHDYFRKLSKMFGYVRGRHQNSLGRQYVLVDFPPLTLKAICPQPKHMYNNSNYLVYLVT